MVISLCFVIFRIWLKRHNYLNFNVKIISLVNNIGCNVNFSFLLAESLTTQSLSGLFLMLIFLIILMLFFCYALAYLNLRNRWNNILYSGKRYIAVLVLNLIYSSPPPPPPFFVCVCMCVFSNFICIFFFNKEYFL